MSKDVSAHQAAEYREDYDYWTPQPHLRHRQITESIRTRLHEALCDLWERGMPMAVLEIGAGNGAFTEPLLAQGAAVTATEMAPAAVAHLRRSFGSNPAFEAVHDEDGSLAVVGSRRYSLIVYTSVLHHIPDYTAAIADAVQRHLAPGGWLLSFQDPRWYPTMPRAAKLLSDSAHVTWRLGEGDVVGGARRRFRRANGVYLDHEQADNVEYHVVRQGVNEEAVRRLLERSFTNVVVDTYWSTWLSPWQKLGEALRLTNTFSVCARGYDPGRPG